MNPGLDKARVLRFRTRLGQDHKKPTAECLTLASPAQGPRCATAARPAGGPTPSFYFQLRKMENDTSLGYAGQVCRPSLNAIIERRNARKSAAAVSVAAERWVPCYS